MVTNLKPAKLMGQKSEGMILSAEKDGVLTLVSLQVQFKWCSY